MPKLSQKAHDMFIMLGVILIMPLLLGGACGYLAIPDDRAFTLQAFNNFGLWTGIIIGVALTGVLFFREYRAAKERLKNTESAAPTSSPGATSMNMMGASIKAGNKTSSTIIEQAQACIKRNEYAEAVRIYRNAFPEVGNHQEHWIGAGIAFHQFVVNNLVPNVAKDTRIFAILGTSTLVSAETRRLWYSLVDKSHCEGLKLCIDEAEQCFRKAVEISPGVYNARVFLGQLYEDMGFYDKARAEFDKIVPVNEEERQGIQSELKYLRETQARNLDADLRPKPGTAAMPIHKMYGEKLKAMLNEIDQNHNGNPSLPW